MLLLQTLRVLTTTQNRRVLLITKQQVTVWDKLRGTRLSDTPFQVDLYTHSYTQQQKTVNCNTVSLIHVESTGLSVSCTLSPLDTLRLAWSLHKLTTRRGVNVIYRLSL